MLDLALAKHFAFLLHPELSESSKLNWWQVKGRPAYRYWSYLSSEEIEALAQPGIVVQVGNQEIAIPRAMELTLAFRDDVLEKFANYADPEKAMAGWFFALGMKEHLFSEIIDLKLLQQLDRSVLLSKDAISINPIASVPAPNMLMVLIWHMLEPKMQEELALDRAETRFRFLAWFFCNAMEVFQLQPLLASRWKSWLREPMVMVVGAQPLPRFAVLANSLMRESERPNIKTVAGLKTMQEWGDAQIKEGETWHWLIDKSKKTFFPFPRFVPRLEHEAQETKETPKHPFGLNLIGFAFGELGIGEDLRMAVAACEAAGIPHRVVNINPGEEVRQEDLSLIKQIEQGLKEASYAINVFIMPGFDMASRIFLRYGDSVLKDHYNIGWWPWELSTWPKAWPKAFDLVDEVWAGSEFSHLMYQKSTTKPSMLMPLAASVERVKPFTRKHFGLSQKVKSAFLFLYVFDFNSHLKRKNPEAAITAFQLAFPMADKDANNVGLVLKVMNTKPTDPAWLAFEKICKADHRIQIVNQTLSREEILGLIQVCDAYVSPHRAEGFGRTLAEAMLLGKAVIATNFSGNQMFMDPKLTLRVRYKMINLKRGDYHFIEDDDGAQWAEPSIEDFAKKMRLAIDHSKDSQFSIDVKTFADKTFSPERTGRLLAERLRTLKTMIQFS
jgi:glycosyltransferase involved in cell wall biosynthesis